MLKKNILYTIDDYHIGGVTSFVKQYTTFLKGFANVTILGFAGDLSNPQAFFPDAKVVVIHKKMNYSFIGRIKGFLNYSKELKTIFAENKIDLIHLSTTWSSLFVLFFPYSWKMTKISTFYGSYSLEDYKNYQNGPKKLIEFFKKKYRKSLQFLVLYFSEKIIIFSDYSRMLICSYFSEKLSKKAVVIPGSVETVKITSKSKSKKNSFVLLNFGRAEPRKGIDILLESTKKLNDLNFGVQLLLASPVDFFLNAHLFQVYEDLNLFEHVRFYHKLNNEQKEILLQRADLFIMPSRDLETFGLTMLESLAAGVPVIGTPAGAIPEVLSRIDPRLLTKDISSSSLVEAIVNFKNLPAKEKLKISNQSKLVIKKFYSHRIVGKKYRNLIEQL